MRVWHFFHHIIFSHKISIQNQSIFSQSQPLFQKFNFLKKKSFFHLTKKFPYLPQCENSNPLSKTDLSSEPPFSKISSFFYPHKKKLDHQTTTSLIFIFLQFFYGLKTKKSWLTLPISPHWTCHFSNIFQKSPHLQQSQYFKIPQKSLPPYITP